MITADKISAGQGNDLDYQTLPLLSLVERIVSEHDELALNELHENRTLFHDGGKNLLLVDYLLHLRDRDISRQWCNASQVVLDNAFDLALEKFIHLPTKNGEAGCSAGTHGTDCRYYYRAYHAHTVGQCEEKKGSNAIDVEILAASRLQNFVTRHFFLACLECVRREQKTTRRYRWKLNGETITLWMPSELTARQCQKWLGENVADGDPRRADERQRVQQIIDCRLVRRKILPLDQIEKNAMAQPDLDVLASLITEQMSAEGLAETVASEKAETIDFQRPAIRALGKESLKNWY